MPMKPKHPCAYPNCPKLTDKRYCEEHQRQVNKDYERYGRKYKPGKRYGSSWQKVRNRYIKQHPLCEQCMNEGRLTLAQHVHHIVPLEQGGTSDESNLMSLCKSCHSTIHARQGDRWH